jgi:hypothetical protein
VWRAGDWQEHAVGAGVEVARSLGFVTLCASEAEARLSFAELADLLGGVD